ncbi:GNAT family N-acetyltransferase [Vagococcus hydrophili]|uniref:GNAT family N-acetyltransferase n=1 Tax=Vagococcus hydrophili TaxID=2714947 RepID=A0A6G8AVK9_9ENTE|nr:GNAT family N-acetyltransferase [Vagococcus hydrophili]QIL49036.1 GNAT family N-acetyltransferase [Vagococcus hydrophili]
MLLPIAKASMPRVTQTWNKGFSDYLVPINMTEQQLNHRIDSLGLSRDFSCVFEEEGAYLGVILLGIQTLNHKRIMWVGGISVDPASRGKHVGTKLMKHAELLATQNNCEGIRLEVIATNYKAKKMYDSLSYSILNELIIADISNLDNKQDSLVELIQFPMDRISLKEPITIPWQNRLIFAQNSLMIHYQHQIIGYLSFTESDSSIAIQQLVIFNEQHLSLIKDILIYLNNQFEKTLTLSNFDSSSKEFSMLHSFGLTTKLTQLQLFLPLKK